MPLKKWAADWGGLGDRKFRTAIAAGLLVTLITQIPVSAGQGGVTFSARIGPRHYCQIVVQQDGVFTQNAAATSLSTTNPGGTKALAQVTATNASFDSFFDITAEDPLSFSQMPAGGDTGVTFQTTYHGTGATEFANIPGTQSVDMKKGITQVSVDFTATRPDTFPDGDYAATVVLRCE